VGDEGALVFLEGADNAFECGCHVGEVGDTASDDEDFTIRAGFTARDEVDCRGWVGKW
jgi:hypothetical protein